MENINLSQCLIKYHTMKTYTEVAVKLYEFLTLTLDGSGQMHVFVMLVLGKCSHWTGNYVCPIVGLDAVAESKIPYPARNQRSVIQL